MTKIQTGKVLFLKIRGVDLQEAGFGSVCAGPGFGFIHGSR